MRNGWVRNNPRTAKVLAAFTLSTLWVASAAFADTLRPYKITASDLKALEAPDVIVESSAGQLTKNRVMGQSTDKAHKAGLYSTPPERADVESYPVDEFMYFIKGGVTLTSADGTVLQVKAGDAVHVPKGWKGTWNSVAGYTKFYVIYDSAKASKQ